METDPVSETFSVEYQLMDKVQKLCNPEYYTPSSDPFRIDLYSVVGGYQHFGGIYCLCLQGEISRTGICKQFAGKVVTQVHRKGERGWRLVQANRNGEQEFPEQKSAFIN
jgi:hypothetical protein